VCVVREISKLHEQFHFGTSADLLVEFDKHPEKIKGEIVVVISA
jgi:16S rRNA C1402 (ribose-2'-O) methylase RsmI